MCEIHAGAPGAVKNGFIIITTVLCSLFNLLCSSAISLDDSFVSVSQADFKPEADLQIVDIDAVNICLIPPLFFGNDLVSRRFGWSSNSKLRGLSKR